MRMQYRAIFRNPYQSWLEYSEPVDNVKDLPTKHHRGDETHQYVDGFQVRMVSEWQDPMNCLRDELKGIDWVPNPIYCDFAREFFGEFVCCDSCHEDWERYDYDMCEVEVDLGGAKRTAIVCCAGSRQIEKGEIKCG